MIHKFTLDILNDYKSCELSPELFADDINGIFMMDTEENIMASLKCLLNDATAKKVYNIDERLYMLTKLLEASQKFGNDFIEQVKKISKGGLEVDKVYTEAELLAKAEELATQKHNEHVEKMTQEDKDKSINDHLESLKSDLASAKEAQEKAEKASEKIQADKDAYEKEQTAKDNAIKRIDSLKEDGLEFPNTKDDIFAMVKDMEDDGFEKLKSIIKDVIAFKKTDESSTEASQASTELVDNSEIIPNSTDGEESAYAGIEAILETEFLKKK